MMAEASFGGNSISLSSDHDGRLWYTVKRNGQTVVMPSRLGLHLANTHPLCDSFTIRNVTKRNVEGVWKPLYGERAKIDDSFEEAAVCVEDDLGRIMEIRLRAYSEGTAFQYFIPEQEKLKDFTITQEDTGFTFPQGSMAWEEHGVEGEYFAKPVGDISGYCERPFAVHVPEGGYVLIHEAGLTDYARMLIVKDEHAENTLKVHLSGHLCGLFSQDDYIGYGFTLNEDETDSLVSHVEGKAPFATPWRTFILADHAAELLCRSNMVLNLSEPGKAEDFPYVKPGKALRDMMLSTKSAFDCIDFCVDHQFQYVLFDGGWYGSLESENKAIDPRREDPDRDLDLRKIISYGKEKGIGIFLYVDRTAAEPYLDAALPVWKEWGIAGIKLGFVKVGPQESTRWLVEAVKKCHEFGLMVNIHDAYRPTGISRTYPNVLTQEGIRGNEHFPTASHNTTLPFVRFQAGAGDYTLCYFDNRLKVTHAHMLAMGVIVYSPMQMMFWYDKPSDWNGEREIEFWEKLPVVWDESIGISGEIGEYATIARRKGSEWFIGCINNEKARTVKIPLHFLNNGKRYSAKIYEDVPELDTRTKVGIRSAEVTKDTILEFPLECSGGVAIYVKPL
ncbi:glycoside hydrolase family 97 protein [Paenibacillus sedimenti]|uniref:Glycoside hydrolase family 97 catalytic domain-containing protein n=1 Tax=Paenibacillus sedimenti TaxID=2770274 RepID=A0A926KTX4_9BACL|nr:glycoside hydrolase family 97 protein [Paenibacillus sedimenti]MBD0384064.1 glycoside hydrolase family 97 catalytic domain-containing protein [Paenibacillus sedimenti]